MRRVDQGDSVRVPLLWIALLVSLLLHGGLLALRWQVPDKPVPPAPEGQGKGALKGRIQAQVLFDAVPAALLQPATSTHDTQNSRRPNIVFPAIQGIADELGQYLRQRGIQKNA